MIKNFEESRQIYSTRRRLKELMFLLALSPILWLVLALSVIKMAPWKACILALIISLAAGMGVWGMEQKYAVESVLEGLALLSLQFLLTT